MLTLTDQEILSLLHLQLALECKRVTTAGLVYRVPCEDPDEIAAVFGAHLVTGQYHVLVAAEAGPELAAAIGALPPSSAFASPAAVLALLPPRAAARLPAFGRTYYFASVPALDDPASVRVTPEGVGLWVEGKRAAWAWSSRASERAAELAVETAPEFRRRGFARQVCAAWAGEQLAAGRVAFYSHLTTNAGSAALARRLGVVPLFDWVAYA